MLLLVLLKLNSNTESLTKSGWISIYGKINFTMTCPGQLETSVFAQCDVVQCLKTVSLAHLDALTAIILYLNTRISLEIVLAAFLKVIGRQ